MQNEVGAGELSFQEALNFYLLSNFQEIDKNYKWDFSVKSLVMQFTKNPGQYYLNSKCLRKIINEKIISNPELAAELQVWYVKEWGGVKSNKIETLFEYIQLAPNILIGRGERGIASWSKMLSIRDPENYAIYDARVAMSLNTISLIKATKSDVFFPQLSSRNKKIIVAQHRVADCARINGIERKENFYQYYLNCLRRAVIECNGKFDIQTAEMILFADAEKLSGLWSGKSTAR
jgi:hypothetical protein